MGGVEFEDDLMVDSANSIQGLGKKMKRLLQNFHQNAPSELDFEFAYDRALFPQKD